jgi:membrane dipeptidase
MKISLIFILIIISLFSSSCLKEMKEPEKKLVNKDIRAISDSLANHIMIVDTHIDVPYRLTDEWEDISKKTANGDFDYPRAIQGGLNVAFIAIYTPAELEDIGSSKTKADNLITMVENLTKEHPDKFALASSVSDVTKQFNAGVISFPLGMENGSPIEGKIENVKYFYTKGIRYITLAHSKSNHISDSSYDENKKWNGLSPFGKRVVKEMNRLGIMVDVSHVSDSAFYQVLEISKAPVIASHSSCRYFTPGWERNMSDEMIKALAKNGGVIQINFGSSFLDNEIRKKSSRNSNYIKKHITEKKLTAKEAKEFKTNYNKENHAGYASVKDVVAHIDHVVKLVGIDYVGLGSDFDGVGDSLPEGLKNVSQYPNLIYELLKSGYSENDIKKICSGNILRVWSEVEKIAKGDRD